MISSKIKKILYDPEGMHINEIENQRVESWLEIQDIVTDKNE